MASIQAPRDGQNRYLAADPLSGGPATIWAARSTPYAARRHEETTWRHDEEGVETEASGPAH